MVDILLIMRAFSRLGTFGKYLEGVIHNFQPGHIGNLLADAQKLRVHKFRDMPAFHADQVVVVRLIESNFIIASVGPEIMLDNYSSFFQQFQC